MAHHKLPNYLRACRKRTGLSQEEIAYLLGFNSAHISKFERFRRTPGFRVALAFGAVYKRPIKELFSGDYYSVEKAILRRVKLLEKRLRGKKTSDSTARKLAHLRSIIEAIEHK